MPGQWTDDTSMAMCLAESLVERGFDVHDQMRRYLRWYRHGYWSSTGVCFDIGITTRQALARFEESGEPVAGSTAPDEAGNGSLMRLAAVPLRYAADPASAVECAAQSSRTTHGTAEAVDACRYFAHLIVHAIAGAAKDDLLSARHAAEVERHTGSPLSHRIAAVARGSFKSKDASQIKASGYVVNTLEAALWAFHHTDTFRDGALLVVNLGEDADTTGAVFGQIAGAYYGVDAIPREWREIIHRANDILALATHLHAAANGG
jgi:ADP-ribosylglycohydrolase